MKHHTTDKMAPLNDSVTFFVESSDVLRMEMHLFKTSVHSFEEHHFIIQCLHRVTRTLCAVTCVAMKTQQNVLKLHRVMYINKMVRSNMCKILVSGYYSRFSLSTAN